MEIRVISKVCITIAVLHSAANKDYITLNKRVPNDCVVPGFPDPLDSSPCSH